MNLADLILEKIEAHEAAQAQDELPGPDDAIPPKVIEVYSK